MNHELLMLLTEQMPMKTIMVRGEPYLERYYMKTEADGTQHWLHRFLRNDSEEHYHSHPWCAKSTILCGHYAEDDYHSTIKYYSQNDVNLISFDTLHRVSAAAPNTWTHMIVYPGRSFQWYFIDSGSEKTYCKPSPIDWWKDCNPRNRE